MIRTILPDNQRLREEINCVLDNGEENHHSPITSIILTITVLI